MGLFVSGVNTHLFLSHSHMPFHWLVVKIKLAAPDEVNTVSI